MTPTEIAEALYRAFLQAPPLFEHEAQLQAILAERLEAVLDAKRVDHAPRLHLYRELVLTKRDRLDFLIGHSPLWSAVPMGTAIEVKVGGSLSDLTRQLARYAESDRITGLLVVTTKDRHRQLPPSLGGKPIAVLCLSDFTLGF
jgi:hypothetical protein